MFIVQTNALREHAALSRKMEAVIKEKRELSKQLAIASKENRGAKQQIEELLTEKAQLLKRLENATKEFKANTKTKKLTLEKLEEADNAIDCLKQQLAQVIRDKEILEQKLCIMQDEYENIRQNEKERNRSGWEQPGEMEDRHLYKEKEHAAMDVPEVVQCFNVRVF